MSKLPWFSAASTPDLSGKWVALDNCRYDEQTLQPVEGDVVDSDKDLTELCARMRETGRSSCSILFCDGQVWVERPHRDDAAPLSSVRRV